MAYILVGSSIIFNNSNRATIQIYKKGVPLEQQEWLLKTEMALVQRSRPSGGEQVSNENERGKEKATKKPILQVR
jgi:hypothetical protein